MCEDGRTTPEKKLRLSACYRDICTQKVFTNGSSPGISLGAHPWMNDIWQIYTKGLIFNSKRTK